MAHVPPPRPPHHSLELEIEKLMRHLPGADPKLVGEPEPDRVDYSGSLLPPPVDAAPRPEPRRSVERPAPRASGAHRRPSVRTHARRAPAFAFSAAMGSATGGVRERLAEAATHLPEALVWMRALLAAGLGVAVLQWPYANECGAMLYLYCGVVASVLVTGGWAATWSWRLRIAPAHLLSLIAIFWGIVLAAEQVLPRIGYAPFPQTWTCVG